MLLAFALVGVAAVPVMASSAGIGNVYLYTDGGIDDTGSNWRFYVETPTAVGLDADYWNFTVYAIPLNASATNTTYYVHIHINDGATNLTKNVTLAVKNTHTVWSNASHAAAAYAAVTVNMSAVLYIELVKAGSGVIDHYRGTISIYENESMANLANVIGAVIALAVIVCILGVLMDSMGKAGKKKKP